MLKIYAINIYMYIDKPYFLPLAPYRREDEQSAHQLQTARWQRFGHRSLHRVQSGQDTSKWKVQE